MWPKTLPPDVIRNTLRSTECQVFKQLEATLDDSFVVFYSRPWLGLSSDGEEIDGECDFVVAHAELGFLAIEVKGGAIARDPSTDRWTSRDRWNVRHNIKNPVQQAMRSKYALLNKLSSSPHWKSRHIRCRHAVIFPHSAAPDGDLGADMPLNLFCFAEQFKSDLGAWILARFGEIPQDNERTKKFGPDGLLALERILALPFRLRSPLATFLSLDDSDLESLTQQQFHIVRAIAGINRVAVSGGAGTGKTVLATEEARRCQENGLRTLFLCYNRGLAYVVRRSMNDLPLISVKTFHGLCAELVRHAGIEIPQGVSRKSLFEETWPELLMQAFERLPSERYDAVIVDEGQDFLPLWWVAVESALDPNGPNILRIFYDNNQRLYANSTTFPDDVGSIPIRLTLNLRNTRRIHELVYQHYAGHEIQSIGPEGIEVQWLTAESLEDMWKLINERVTRLVSIEHIPVDDIAVLASSDKKLDEISDHLRLDGLLKARCDEDTDGHIVVDSIRRFKGLERAVTVIAATRDIVKDKELPYVALSRARTCLIIVGTQNVLDRLRGEVHV